MKNILLIESSPNLATSVTRKLTGQIVERLRAKYSDAAVTLRDLASFQVPHLDDKTVQAFVTKSDADQGSVKLSLELIEDLRRADLIIIAFPMYNFGIPSSLKAWIDHVTRSGKTFAYGQNGPVGLLENKKAIMVTAAAGIYSVGPMKEWDFAEPYMRHALKFIGINDVQVVRAEGLAIPDQSQTAVAKAETAVKELAL